MKKEYKIFVVDDDQFFLKVFSRKVAKSTKVKVVSFDNAEDCLARLNENPDLIITDFYLANGRSDRMNGDELLKQVKVINEKIPVMIMSAQEHSELMIDLLQMGAADYIDKNTSTLERSMTGVRNILNQIVKDYQTKEQKKVLQMLIGVFALISVPIFILNFLAPALIVYYVFASLFVMVGLSVYNTMDMERKVS